MQRTANLRRRIIRKKTNQGIENSYIRLFLVIVEELEHNIPNSNALIQF